MASGVVKILYSFFQNSVDKLPEERSLIRGKPPLFLNDTTADSLMLSLFGAARTSDIELGADQAIIVRNEKVQEDMQKIIPDALVLTVLECKGLEFEDVLIYNFFADSEYNSWRVLFNLPFEMQANYTNKPLFDSQSDPDASGTRL